MKSILEEIKLICPICNKKLNVKAKTFNMVYIFCPFCDYEQIVERNIFNREIIFWKTR